MTIEEKRQKTRLRNIKWRMDNPQGYLQAAAKYRKNHPERLSAYKLKVKYNITPAHYNELLTIQNNRCAICGNAETFKHPSSNKTVKLAVDHCHTNGKVRGLLCMNCNRGLGKFHDDIVTLENAIKYLRKFQS